MADRSPKIEFYIALWRDYKEYKNSGMLDQAYIYRYLQNRKNEKANKEYIKYYKEHKGSARPDVYIYIQSLFLCLANKQISKKELTTELHRLVSEKTYLRSFSGELDRAGNNEKHLEILRKKLLDCTLRKDIQVFFNDIGYVESMPSGEPPKPPRENPETISNNKTSRKGKESHKTKQNEILDLYFGFESERSLGISILNNSVTQTMSTDRLGDETYLDECRHLFETLLDNKSGENAFVPLILDDRSGAGIFIIGRSILGIPRKQYRLKSAVTHEKEKTGKDDLDPNSLRKIDIMTYLDDVQREQNYRIPVENPNCAYYIAYFSDITNGDYSEIFADKFNEVKGKREVIETREEGHLELCFSIIHKFYDLKETIAKYKEINSCGKFYGGYSLVNKKMIELGLGRNHPRFADYFIDRTEETQSSEHKAIRSEIEATREDQLHHAQLMK